MTQYHDTKYLHLVQNVLQAGFFKTSRTGVPTRSVFGRQMRFNLSDGTIPLLTTKKMFLRGVIHEILWYLQGTGNIKYLKDNNVTIWDEWADDRGDLGPVYGVMWRKWPNYEITEFDNPSDEPLFYVEDQSVDQIDRLIETLKTNPDDRRLLVTAWNPALLPDTSKSFAENVADGKQALPPCHFSFQCYTRELSKSEREILYANTTGNTSPSAADMEDASIPTRALSMILNQRSCDVGLGVPFNIVQYSILMRMIAHVCNMHVDEFIWNGGDVHIYENHVDQLTHQTTLTPYPSPFLKFARKVDSLDDFVPSDFIIEGYESHPTIKMDVAV